MDYANTFIKSEVAHVALEAKLFPNIKEVTETLSCFYAVTQNIMPERGSLGRRDINVVVVGDGGTPRTAAWFALNTAWNCYSVDPEMSNKAWESKFERLACYRHRVQDVKIDCGNRDTIIVHPHSHARLSDSIASLHNYKNLRIVAMPCCVPQVIHGREADIVYNDAACLSPHNKIKIWKGLS